MPKRATHPHAACRIAADRATVAVEFLRGSGAQGYMRFDRNQLTEFIA